MRQLGKNKKTVPYETALYFKTALIGNPADPGSS